MSKFEMTGGPNETYKLKEEVQLFLEKAENKRWTLKRKRNKLVLSIRPACEVWQLGKVDAVDSIVDGVDAYSLRVRWSTIQPERGLYLWDMIDAAVNRCKAHSVKLVLRVLMGVHSPNWSYDSTIEDDRTSKDGPIPDPRSDLHFEATSNFLRMICKRYKEHVHAVHVPGFGDSSETNRPRGWEDQVHNDLAFSDVFIQRVLLIQNVVGARRTIVNFGNVSAPWVQEVIFRINTTIGVQHNSLSARTEEGAEHHQLIKGWGGRKGFQFVSPHPGKDDRFGGPLEDGVQYGLEAGAEWLEVYEPNCADVIRIIKS